MKRRSTTIGPLVMLGVCLGLGYVVQDELGRAPERAPPVAAGVSDGAARDTGPPPRRAAPRATPIRAYSETLARPLFHASRKPAPKVAAVTPDAPAAEPPTLDLVGVMIAPQDRSALIRLPSSSELVEVSVGERLEGWRLETIESDRIVLKSGKASAVYRIDAELR